MHNKQKFHKNIPEGSLLICMEVNIPETNTLKLAPCLQKVFQSSTESSQQFEMELRWFTEG